MTANRMIFLLSTVCVCVCVGIVRSHPRKLPMPTTAAAESQKICKNPQIWHPCLSKKKKISFFSWQPLKNLYMYDFSCKIIENL